MFNFANHLLNFLQYFSSGIKTVWSILGWLVMPPNVSNLSYYGFWGLALTVVCLIFIPSILGLSSKIISKM